LNEPDLPVKSVLVYFKLQWRMLLEVDADYWMRIAGFDGRGD